MKIVFDEKDIKRRLNKALQSIALKVENSLIDKLTFEHGRDTGQLASSIDSDIQGNVITISMAEHGKYVEFGTPPHMPPVDALEGWADRKLGDKDLKWAVAMAIKKRGTRPYPFIRPTFNNEVVGIIENSLKSAFK